MTNAPEMSHLLRLVPQLLSENERVGLVADYMKHGEDISVRLVGRMSSLMLVVFDWCC